MLKKKIIYVKVNNIKIALTDFWTPIIPDIGMDLNYFILLILFLLFVLRKLIKNNNYNCIL